MDLKLGERGVILSIFAHLCLSTLKLVIGYIANSEALKVDGFIQFMHFLMLTSTFIYKLSAPFLPEICNFFTS
jgi:divalent metal cation (Fe/Co/Zn/Cd) transporter